MIAACKISAVVALPRNTRSRFRPASRISTAASGCAEIAPIITAVIKAAFVTEMNFVTACGIIDCSTIAAL